MKCVKGYEIRALKSAAGWYMGTTDDEGFPNCRISSQYAKTKEEAEKLLLDRQDASENQFCRFIIGKAKESCVDTSSDIKNR
ncbi:MAG: hypothetical protein J6S85_09285 [Methanobrevibacter sp.]|nr:hypothetical protein [Methanobrevibacter sp.]